MILSEAGCRRIHEGALEVLARTGVPAEAAGGGSVRIPPRPSEEKLRKMLSGEPRRAYAAERVRIGRPAR